jgi:hypothetical protein
MKYLRLTHTEECFNIIRCLEQGVITGKAGSTYNPKLYGVTDAGFLLTDAGDDEWIEFSKDEVVLIPIDAIKINVFQAMKHRVQVANAPEGMTPIPMGLITNLEYDNDGDLMVIASVYIAMEENVNLDFTADIDGASVVEL